MPALKEITLHITKHDGYVDLNKIEIYGEGKLSLDYPEYSTSIYCGPYPEHLFREIIRKIERLESYSNPYRKIQPVKIIQHIKCEDTQRDYP